MAPRACETLEVAGSCCHLKRAGSMSPAILEIGFLPAAEYAPPDDPLEAHFAADIAAIWATINACRGIGCPCPGIATNRAQFCMAELNAGDIVKIVAQHRRLQDQISEKAISLIVKLSTGNFTNDEICRFIITRRLILKTSPDRDSRLMGQG